MYKCSSGLNLHLSHIPSLLENIVQTLYFSVLRISLYVYTLLHPPSLDLQKNLVCMSVYYEERQVEGPKERKSKHLQPVFLSFTLVVSLLRPFCLSSPSGNLYHQLSGSGRQSVCHLTCQITYKLLAVNPLIRNCISRPPTNSSTTEKEPLKGKERGSGLEKSIQSA